MRNTPSIVMLALFGIAVSASAFAQRTEPPTMAAPPETRTTDTTPKPMTFADLDVNADGKVSKDEAMADAKLTSHFAQVDRDGDGQLSQTEFAAGHGAARQY
ncbi:EF-hand domain-containing protein [Lysobacter sp. LF1]|uniref:EF-hand domain-containing protein n=1 Tax=Lysobacter stagni TaxID=3045172 RepID=A0ABT6XKD3_9GAMM|nr:EF-hand domain-containing protein [Lysobacter sp. LF1]MDI9240630.1 EF-hand domain-containing protein [Lysobacter sp. LF1]